MWCTYLQRGPYLTSGSIYLCLFVPMYVNRQLSCLYYFVILYVILCMSVYTGELICGMHVETHMHGYVVYVCIQLNWRCSEVPMALISGPVKEMGFLPLAFRAICQLLLSLFLPTLESSLCFTPLSPGRLSQGKDSNSSSQEVGRG